MDNNSLLIVLSLISFLAGIGAAATYAGIKSFRNQIRDLSKQVESLKANRRHSPAGLHQHNVGEALVFRFSDILANEKILHEQIEYTRRLAMHIAAGGDPDDKPANWKSLREEK